MTRRLPRRYTPDTVTTRSSPTSDQALPLDPSSAAVRSLVETLALAVLLIVAYALLPLRGDREWLGFGLGLLLVAGTVPFVGRRLRRLQVSSHPALEAVEAIALLLTMVVVGFAAIYYQLGDVEGEFRGLDTRLDALYFTVVTLSTVGFGDIVPTGQTARAVVTIQVVVNFGFIGGAVRIVTRVAQDRRASVSGADGG